MGIAGSVGLPLNLRTGHFCKFDNGALFNSVKSARTRTPNSILPGSDTEKYPIDPASVSLKCKDSQGMRGIQCTSQTCCASCLVVASGCFSNFLFWHLRCTSWTGE